MNFEYFSNHFVFQGRVRLSLDQRPYARAIHGAMEGRPRVVLACGRQVEKTTLLLKHVLYRSLVVPGHRTLYVLPRMEQVLKLVHSRLGPMLASSPLVRKVLMAGAQERVRHHRFRNGSELMFEAAYLTADSVRGISADTVLCDETQDLAPDALTVIQETLSHASKPQMILAGTSKLASNMLEQEFERSTQNIWTIACAGCGVNVPADGKIIGPDGYCCPHCQHLLNPRDGFWDARAPAGSYAVGFRIPQLMVPWLTHRAILDKKQTYTEFQFLNEVLGEPVLLGDLLFDYDRLVRCCEARAMARSQQDLPAWARDRVMAGVDWGHIARSTTAVCLGALDDDYAFHVFRWDVFPAGSDPVLLCEKVAELCRRFGVAMVGADGLGNGYSNNAMLLPRLASGGEGTPVLSLEYHAGNNSTCHWDTSYRGRGMLAKTIAISGALTRVNERRILFPRKADSERFLREIASERCLFDEKTGQVHYEKSVGRPDHALHALCYALAVAQWVFRRQLTY